MTSPSNQLPVDPDEFRSGRSYRSKLLPYADAVKDLLNQGYSDWMVWRYLNEACQVKVSRNTVYRFCVRMRAEGEKPRLSPGAAPVPERERNPSPAAERAVPASAEAIHSEGGTGGINRVSSALAVDPRAPTRATSDVSANAREVVEPSGSAPEREAPGGAAVGTRAQTAENAEVSTAAFEPDGAASQPRIGEPKTRAIAHSLVVHEPYNSHDCEAWEAERAV